MTTPIPTNNVAGTGFPGLPDVAALAQLANELFAALPSSVAPAGTALPLSPPAPSAAYTNPALAERAPSLMPSATTPTGVPDVAIQAAPAANSRAGGPLLGVPEAYAIAPIAVPQISVPVSPPSTPYYFLGESSAYTSTVSTAGTPELPGEDRVAVQAFEMPGAPSLRALLADLNRAPDVATAAKPSSGFYFVDPPMTTAGLPHETPHAGAVPSVPAGRGPFDVHAVRRDFPILSERVNGRQLIWLDNAATTQKPQAVIDRLAYFYAHENSNIHRAAHELAARATDAYEAARSKVAKFIGAGSAEEIIFVRGATEAINLVAQSWGRANIGEGDEIVVSHLEHHANIVPWHMLAAEKGARLRVIPVDDHGQVRLDEYRKLLNGRTKIVAVTQVSNALGTIVPVHEIVQAAHAVGARALIDGAQSVSHLRVDMQTLDADFFVFSGHKVFGPTGIGVVYGKREVLEQMPPWQGGGNMIQDVTFERILYNPPPGRLEAGTGNIADAVGLGAAIDYVQRLGLENIARYEHDLLLYATQGLRTVPGLKLIGTAPDKTSVMSFVLEGFKTEEVGTALNQEGIAVRAGHHCAQPILRRFGYEATVRPSLAFYNTCEEIDTLVAALRRLVTGRGPRRTG